MKTIYKSRLPKPEADVRADLAQWRNQVAEHALTVGQPAPFPEYELLRYLEDGFLVLDEEDSSDEKLPKTFEELKLAKREKVNTRRSELERGGFMYLDKMFDSDEQSFYRMLSANDLALKTQDDFTLSWVTQDNSEIDLNREQILGMIPALTAYGAVIFEKAKQLKKQIDACETEEQLALIDPEFTV